MQSLTAKDVMTTHVITVEQGASIEQALRLMAEYCVSGLPVIDGSRKLVGMITENDVLLKDKIDIPHPRMALYGLYVVPDDLITKVYKESRGIRVEDAMTKKVISFSEDASLTEIAKAMVDRKINRVPIVKDGKVIGIVSRADIIRAMASSAK